MRKGGDNNIVQNGTDLKAGQENFAAEYARNLSGLNPYFFNPFLANMYLKNINMHPLQQTRERIQQIINDPKNNEQLLRRLSQYFYNTQMSYKRMVHYLADILTFDWYPIPINATEEDMEKSTFKRDYEAVCNWFDRFDVKKEFRKALLKMAQEDGYFTYLREDDEGDLFLQELPIDYCMIDSYWKYGYLYSFDLMYFKQPGVDINGFPKEFKTYYSNALDMKKNKTYYPNIKPQMRGSGQWVYWQQLEPGKSWIFKFHNHFAGLVPPFLGVFLDLYDLPNLKDLHNAKSELEVYKIIMGSVPRNKDEKSSKDNFSIQADTLAKFVQLVKGSLQNKYVDFKAVPLEDLKMFSFEDTANKDDVLATHLNNLSTQTGIDRNLFNTNRPNVANMNLTKLVDSVFIDRLYSQFSDFATYHANNNKNKKSKYKFKIVFEGTIFDRTERLDRYLRVADKGMILAPQISSAMGMSIKDFTQSMALTKSLNFVDKLEILPTSYTRSAKDNVGGRPSKKDDELGEAGEISRTAGSNEGKVVAE